MQRDIFISHAGADKPLVDAFVDLLQTGLDIKQNQIFCTSLEGLGIPAGKDFIDYIKGQIQEPKVVIAIISPNYNQSEFCLCELGATWAMAHNLFPLLVPPTKYKDLGGVLTVTQAIPIDDHSKLSEMADELLRQLGQEMPNTARWNKKSQKFIDDLQATLDSVHFPQKITENKFADVQKELVETRQYVDELDSENEDLKKQIEELSACKDAEQVNAVKSKHTDHAESDEYLKLVESACKASDQFFGEVKKVLIFYHLAMVYTPDWNYYRDNYEEGARRGYFEDAETLSPKPSNRHVGALFAALDQLEKFLEEPSEKFIVWFDDNYESDMEINNSEFLETMNII